MGGPLLLVFRCHHEGSTPARRQAKGGMNRIVSIYGVVAKIHKKKKKTINSIFDFRISTFGWGAGHYNILKKFRHLNAMTYQAFVMANWTVISDNS